MTTDLRSPDVWEATNAGETFGVLLVSRHGHLVDGFHEYRGEALPEVGESIDIRQSGSRRVIRARVTDVAPFESPPIAAVELFA